MNDDDLNGSIRTFLRTVGVSSQLAIEMPCASLSAVATLKTMSYCRRK
jgi:hypothetical protein